MPGAVPGRGVEIRDIRARLSLRLTGSDRIELLAVAGRCRRNENRSSARRMKTGDTAGATRLMRHSSRANPNRAAGTPLVAPARQHTQRNEHAPGRCSAAYLIQESTSAELSCTHCLAYSLGSAFSITRAWVMPDTMSVVSLTLPSMAAASGCDCARAVA